MAITRPHGLVNQLDITQILLEAQNRWLRPTEICEILQNYKIFRISSEPLHRPPSGSLFLFDRKVLRYFRKDGHNWRKKKDGKTVKEAHERLKTGSIDVLHCYYAHGNDNEGFQRRSYWMLEEDLSHIVLVHYREVKGSKINFNLSSETEEAFSNSQGTEDIVLNSETESSFSSRFHLNSLQAPSQTTDTTSINSVHAFEYEDVESEFQQPVGEKPNLEFSVPYFPLSFSDDYEAKVSSIPLMNFGSLAQHENGKSTEVFNLEYEPQKHLNLPSWEDMLQNCNAGIQNVPFQSSTQNDTIGIIAKQEHEIPVQLFTDALDRKRDLSSHTHHQEQWQIPSRGNHTHSSLWTMVQKFPSDSACDLKTIFERQRVNDVNSNNYLQPREVDLGQQIENLIQNNHEVEFSNAECLPILKPDLVNREEPQLDRAPVLTEGLNKIDSFNQWMSKELSDVDESTIQSNSGNYWDNVESENGVDDPNTSLHVKMESYTVGPSLSQDQLFSIIDFSPNWGYSDSETKILIMGKFLKNTENVKWSCMFGEVEVQAEAIMNGVLRCYTPLNKSERVPFYVTCSNRQACSEIREFEYRANVNEDIEFSDRQNGSTDLLKTRLGKMLALRSVSTHASLLHRDKLSDLSNKIISMLKVNNADEWSEMLKLTSNDKFSVAKGKEELLQKMLRQNLHDWLLYKVSGGGKGPGVLDEGGQGVLHLAAALGYDWAIPPTVISGVSVNFRDVNGWTALHWAASCGRERTVVSLVSLGAAPGALTDPTPLHPLGQTPADLASALSHKGISGYLAESSLSAHLSSLNLKDSKETDSVLSPGMKAVQDGQERTPTPVSVGDVPYGLSMKDSLAAVCNATQAAARIHQAFRVESFRRKQIIDYGDDERAYSFFTLKNHRLRLCDEPVHAAAIRIQNKFRSWKGRRDYLIIRQRIVKIQAHVRGHQVRKSYRSITWSVGILEKVILRWRRKGSGLRGFKPEALSEDHWSGGEASIEDEYDFLKEGRKQTEERLEKALARVKSMVHYPEGRDQYRRLLTVVNEIQETKVTGDDAILHDSERVDLNDDLIDLEALFDDDTFMSAAY